MFSLSDNLNNDPRTTATLSFLRSQLLYDIGNIAYVEGDIMPDDNAHAKHQMIDITQTGNIDRVTRLLSLAFSAIVERLYPYTKQTVVDGTSYDDTLTEPDTYSISLSLPQGFSTTTLNLLEHLIHELLVCYVLAQWTASLNPNASANWLARQDDLLQQIQEAVNTRIGRVRRTQTPF